MGDYRELALVTTLCLYCIFQLVAFFLGDKADIKSFFPSNDCNMPFMHQQ